MSTNGILDFQNTNKVIFRGTDSNVVVDTSNASIGIGIQGTEKPGSNLHVIGDASISSNLKLTTDTSITVNSNVVTDFNGPHVREPKEVPLKKYPDIEFEYGKLDANETTFTYTQAGYTVKGTNSITGQTSGPGPGRTPWKAFSDLNDGGMWQPTGFSHDTGNNGSADNVAAAPVFGPDNTKGAWVSLELPKKIKLQSVYVKSVENTEKVRIGKLYGSNNNSDWVTIKDDYTLTYSGSDANDTVNSTVAYKYIVFQIRATGGAAQVDPRKIRYYGYEEDPPAGDISVDTTFKSVMNTPQTTGANVYVDGNLGETFTNRVTGPDATGTATSYDQTGKYWEMNGQLTSNITVEANTFLEGDQPHTVSVWFNSSNLEANVSNTCVFSISDQENLDSYNLDLQSNTWHNLTYAYQGEGGSRVTYLDGRKVSEDPAEDTFGDYPPFVMTGYSQGGYVVTESSIHSTYSAWHVFDGQITFANGENLWISPQNSYSSSDGSTTMSTSDANATTIGGTITPGEWIQVELPHKLKLSSISVMGPTGNGGTGSQDLARSPQDAHLVGSNDGTTWVSVLTMSGVTGWALQTYKSFPANVDSTNAYKYFRFIITKTGGTTVGVYASIQELKFYGHHENDLVRLPDPTNVLKYPHIALTGVSDIDDMAQRGYVITSSGKYPTGSEDQQPSKIFDGDTSTFWKVKHEYTVGGSGGTHSGNNLPAPGPLIVTVPSGSVTKTGEFVILETPHKLKITKVDVVATFAGRRPTKVAILGSNTKTQTGWRLLNDDTLTLPAQDTNTVTIPSPTYYYKYHAYVILQATSGHAGAQTYELRYYGTEEATSIPIQIGGGNIDKVANFRVYDKFIDQNQALEIWDAQKDEFGRAKSSMTLQKGRLGIGTTEPEGRLAVADEPDPDTYGLQKFPPRALSANDTHIDGHGIFKVSASRETSTNTQAWEVFDGILDISSGWDSLKGTDQYSESTGDYIGSDITTTIDGGQISGTFIQLEMPYKVKLQSISIMPQKQASNDPSFYGGARMPKTGSVVGSNDGVNWYLIASIGQTAYSDGIFTPFQTASTTFYSYFRLIAQTITQGANSTWRNRFNLCEFKLFGYREQVTKQSVLHDGQLTLTKNLTVPRIGPALDADDTPRRDRLVVEYNTSTNPTFGGFVEDTSGRGNDACMKGSTSYSSTMKAIDIAGVPNGSSAPTTSAYLDVSQRLPFKGNQPHTISFWYNKRIFSHTQGLISLWLEGTDYNSEGHHSGISQQASGRFSFWHWGADQIFTDPFGDDSTGWRHITAVYTGTTVADQELYINGIRAVFHSYGSGNGTETIDITNAKMTMGQDIYRGNYYFQCDTEFSGIKVYDTALTAEEVKTLYDMGRCDEGHQTTMVSRSQLRMGGENLVIEPCIKGFYEEGTWDPIIYGSTSGKKTPTSSNKGWFVRVGNLVTIGGTIAWNGGDTTLSGQVRVGYLPYPSASVTDHRVALNFGVSNSGITTTSGQNTIRLVIDPGQVFIYVMVSNEYRSTTLNYSHYPSIGASGIIYGIGGTYMI